MSSKRTEKRERLFLDALAQTGSVAKACASAQVGRTAVYRWKAADPKFAERWNTAYEAGTDRLEDCSVEFATAGFVEYRETVVTIAKDGTRAETTTERRKISERHLELQLKARRPDKYRERSSVEHSGPNGGPIQVDDARQRIAGKLDAIARRKDGGSSGPGTPAAA